MAQAVGRYWKAAISALNSKTRLIIQELNHIRNRFPFFDATHFIKQSKTCSAPLNKLLINQQIIHHGQQT